MRPHSPEGSEPGEANNERLLSQAERIAVQAAYDVFRMKGEWPTHQYVDRALRSQSQPSLREILGDLPPDLVQQPPPYGPQERVSIKVSGIAFCSNAARDLTLFLRALAWLVQRSQAFQPDPMMYSELKVTADEFRLEAFPLGQRPTDLEFTKVYELLRNEPLSLGSNPGQFAGDWSLTVPADVTEFAGLNTVDEYVAFIRQRYPSRTLTLTQQRAAIASLVAPHDLRALTIEPTKDVIVRDARRIFLVHGHDEPAREEVREYLAGHGLEVIVLQDQPNKSRTVIEKFEANADVDYAVILFTPDDVGRKADQASKEQMRARQNVVFELGFFIGKLGREKVCLLYKTDTEIPSDLHGVTYTSLDTASWRKDLRRELIEAGIAFADQGDGA